MKLETHNGQWNIVEAKYKLWNCERDNISVFLIFCLAFNVDQIKMDRFNEDYKKQPIKVGFYDIEETIGKGNFAVVKMARHRITKSRVILYILELLSLVACSYK